MNRYEKAYADFRCQAVGALSIFKAYCNNELPPRVPGMDTVIRLAYRISLGASIEEAAAKEYVYRWFLAVKPSDQVIGYKQGAVSIFGVPHTLGF